jgi:stage II sporulation protein P
MCGIGAMAVVLTLSLLWKFHPGPVQGLDGAVTVLPSLIYKEMLAMEFASLPKPQPESAFSATQLSSFLTRLTMGIDLTDPRTFIAQVLPGMRGDKSIVVIRGIGTEPLDYPVEVPPAVDLQNEPQGEQTELEPVEMEQVEVDTTEVEPPGVRQETSPAQTPPAEKPEVTSPMPEPLPIFFVYHTHPEEAFLPELDGITKVDRAFDERKSGNTVTAIGSRLTAKLNKLGVGAIHSDHYYPWFGAYNKSRQTVKAAMTEHKQLQYFIDIHRDAARKEKTILKHKGVTYAKLFFVIGQKNPKYEQNLALAQELHRRVENKLQGLSRGVVLKKEGSNGEFNQSLSPRSVLVEVGGVDNTLAEGYRSAGILAEVLAEMYWEETDAVEASAPAKANKTQP